MSFYINFVFKLESECFTFRKGIYTKKGYLQHRTGAEDMVFKAKKLLQHSYSHSQTHLS